MFNNNDKKSVFVSDRLSTGKTGSGPELRQQEDVMKKIM